MSRVCPLAVLFLVVSCGSRGATSATGDTTPTPVAPTSTKTYANPEIDGRPVAQCVTGEGWGAGARGRCGVESQKIIANEFCKSQDADSFAVDWRVDKGSRGRHAIWRYTRGSPPEKGIWSHGLTVDRFTEIRCGSMEPGEAEPSEAPST